MKLYNLSIYEIQEKIKGKEVKAMEVLESILKRIDTMETKVQSYITLRKDIALEKAKAIDKKIENNEPIGELAGIPMAIKDNICTEGILTTCGSKMLSNFVPPYSATAYERLLAEDGIMLGKTNMDEFTMGSSTEGSAAAVAAGEALFALGSDTGGAIRQSSASYGLVGLKPTYGLVSRYGLVAMANSLDQIGPITKNVTDCAMVLNTIAGYDHKDGTSASRKKVDYCKNLNGDIKGLKIALPREYFGEGLSGPVQSALVEAVKVFQDLGATCYEVSMPNTKYAMAAYNIISQSEASLALSRFDGIRYGYRSQNYTNIDELVRNTRTEGFGLEVKKRMIMGTYWLSSNHREKYYKKAENIRKLLKMELNHIFSNYDLILTPIVARAALNLGESNLSQNEMDQYTVPSSLTGIPALSIACGLHDGLAIGIQLMGRHFDEETILKAARGFERSINLNDQLRP